MARRVEIEGPIVVLLIVLCAGVSIVALNGKSRMGEYGRHSPQWRFEIAEAR